MNEKESTDVAKKEGSENSDVNVNRTEMTV